MLRKCRYREQWDQVTDESAARRCAGCSTEWNALTNRTNWDFATSPGTKTWKESLEDARRILFIEHAIIPKDFKKCVLIVLRRFYSRILSAGQPISNAILVRDKFYLDSFLFWSIERGNKFYTHGHTHTHTHSHKENRNQSLSGHRSSISRNGRCFM